MSSSRNRDVFLIIRVTESADVFQCLFMSASDVVGIFTFILRLDVELITVIQIVAHIHRYSLTKEETQVFELRLTLFMHVRGLSKIGRTPFRISLKLRMSRKRYATFVPLQVSK